MAHILAENVQNVPKEESFSDKFEETIQTSPKTPGISRNLDFRFWFSIGLSSLLLLHPPHPHTYRVASHVSYASRKVQPPSPSPLGLFPPRNDCKSPKGFAFSSHYVLWVFGFVLWTWHVVFSFSTKATTVKIISHFIHTHTYFI